MNAGVILLVLNAIFGVINLTLAVVSHDLFSLLIGAVNIGVALLILHSLQRHKGA